MIGSPGQRSIFLISCSREKRSQGVHAASELYLGDLFRKSLDLARLMRGKPYILSSKHGLLNHFERVPTYNQSLRDLSKSEREAWGERVRGQLAEVLLTQGDFYRGPVVVLAGELYRKPLLEMLGDRCQVPLANLGIGQQKSLLWREIQELRKRK